MTKHASFGKIGLLPPGSIPSGPPPVINPWARRELSGGASFKLKDSTSWRRCRYFSRRRDLLHCGGGERGRSHGSSGAGDGNPREKRYGAPSGRCPGGLWRPVLESRHRGGPHGAHPRRTFPDSPHRPRLRGGDALVARLPSPERGSRGAGKQRRGAGAPSPGGTLAPSHPDGVDQRPSGPPGGLGLEERRCPPGAPRRRAPRSPRGVGA